MSQVMNIFDLRGIDSSHLSGPRRRLELCAEFRQSILARPLTAADTRALLTNELDRARLANALGEAEVLHDAVSAGSTFGAAMAQREYMPDGRVVVQLGDKELAFPDGPAGATPAWWLDGLALAILAGDQVARRILAAAEVFDAISASAVTEAAAVGSEPFWNEYRRAIVALLANQPAAKSHAINALAQMSAGPIGALDPQGLAAIERPVLELICLLEEGPATAWRSAVERAIDAFHTYYSSDETSYLVIGYLPLTLLAVTRIAADRNFGDLPQSPYLPASLLRPNVRLSQSHIVFDFGRRSVLNADEANWFLDLQEFPRARRTHRLLDSEGRLIAHYEAYDAPAMPHATADFLIVDAADMVTPALWTDAPPALDAGELLFLAEAFASRPMDDSNSDSLREPRTLLSDAVACVDSALQRIPQTMDAVPADSIVSDEGRKILAQEPERFRRDRLTAYRGGLTQQLSRLDDLLQEATGRAQAARIASGSPAQSANSSAESMIAAAAAIEVIREQAMPVLEAIRQDTSGQIIAGLRPKDSDYEKVFVGKMVEQVRSAYREVWSGEMQIPYPSTRQTVIHCAVAPAGMLDHPNELSRNFPGGYAAIASALNPHRVWIAWKYLEPGAQAGISFDGLVWVDDHWAWFPKPYRVLRAGTMR